MQTVTIRFTTTLLALAAMVLPACTADKLDISQRWVYLSSNLARPEIVDADIELMARAEKAGCNGVLLTDSKFGTLTLQPKSYFANVERLKKAAVEHHIDIIPAVFPLGWSNDLLANDPNLAEGMPVKDALFVVKNGEAALQADPAVSLKGGDFADLKAWDFHDPAVAYDAAEKALCITGGAEHARVNQVVKVSPHREYRLSVRIKTQDFQGEPTVAILPVKNSFPDSLVYPQLQVPATSDWKTYTLVFNSLDNAEVSIYLGAWEAKSGKAWIADAKLEEVGLLNALRRPGAPLTVKMENGAALVEGKDFAAYADPKLGQIPWPGEYETAHDAPPLKILSPLPDGTRLRVSWYHPMIVYGGSVMLCPSEPKTQQLLHDETVAMHNLFHAKSYFMSHDEIRTMNWCEACESRHETPGQILADNVKRSIKTLKEINPGGTIYVWSDMFDPHHNAHDKYYFVNGTLADSWKGLDKDVIVCLWYLDERANSMKFFSELGNRMMIAGYYDSPPENMAKWLDTAQDYPGKVMGTMYTTWANDYHDLEAFEKVVNRYRK